MVFNIDISSFKAVCDVKLIIIFGMTFSASYIHCYFDIRQKLIELRLSVMFVELVIVKVA